MKLAIMQPYVFPYIGYFHLLKAVDKFVIYDDVNYIKQGWINRNRILLGDKDFLFTIPLEDASSFQLINNIKTHQKSYNGWRVKFYKTLSAAYKKAPNYERVLPLIQEVLDNQIDNIADLATKSILAVSDYLGLQTEIVPSSAMYNNKNLSGKERVIDICRQEKASTYINAIGGQEMYTKDHFQSHNINLWFIKPNEVKYPQFGKEFIPWLSIIDVLMFNSAEDTSRMLDSYDLL